jgi:hypothetical protein
MRPHILPLQLKNSPNSSFFFALVVVKKRLALAAARGARYFPLRRHALFVWLISHQPAILFS